MDELRPLLRMLELGLAFMAMTFAVFVAYGLSAARVRNRIISRPNVMTWLRRAFAAGFVALEAKRAFAERSKTGRGGDRSRELGHCIQRVELHRGDAAFDRRVMQGFLAAHVEARRLRPPASR